MAYNEFNDLVHLGSQSWAVIEPILERIEGICNFELSVYSSDE